MMADTVHQAFISHASMVLSFSDLIFRLRHRVLVYTYVITYYFHPEKADTRVWYVPGPSAATHFTHR